MSNDYTSRHVSKRCLMMLGMESLHWWYVGGWGSGADAGKRGPVPAVESGEETPGCYQTLWHNCSAVSCCSHVTSHCLQSHMTSFIGYDLRREYLISTLEV